MGQGDEQLGIGVLAEVLDLDIAAVVVEHIAAGDALRGYLATGDGDMTDLLLAVADDAEFHLRILRTLQAMHGLLVGDFLTDEHRVIDLDNLIACQQSGTFGRTVADDILHADGVLTDGELNTNT